jgi:hypothetical protein
VSEQYFEKGFISFLPRECMLKKIEKMGCPKELLNNDEDSEIDEEEDEEENKKELFKKEA